MRAAALVVLILTAVPVSLTAQEASLLAGGVHARYADSVSGSAALFSLRLRGTSPSATGTFEGLFSPFAAGAGALQLGGHGVAFGSLGAGVFAGVSGSVMANNFTGGPWSGGAAVGPVFAFSGQRVLATLGASVGALRRVDESSFAVGTGYLRIGYEVARGISLEGGMIGTTADTIRYGDAKLGVSFRNRRILVSFGGGGRIGGLADDPWGQARVEFFAAPWLALEGTAGRYPRDLSGFTSGVFASLGARIRFGRSRSESFDAPEPAVRIDRSETGRVRISITYDKNATTLEIAGDWSDWTPLPLRHEGSDRWSIELQLQPGTYKYALLVDGEHWTIPTGAPSLPDDFGGEVGLLIVR